MGFNGTVRSNEDQHTARILSAQAARIPRRHSSCPKFEATWDATESADIEAPSQLRRRRSADEVAALKARDETLKNAPPKQLASKDLVRKSRPYWDGYQTDMIREVFDGGFGAAMDENRSVPESLLHVRGNVVGQISRLSAGQSREGKHHCENQPEI